MLLTVIGVELGRSRGATGSHATVWSVLCPGGLLSSLTVIGTELWRSSGTTGSAALVE